MEYCFRFWGNLWNLMQVICEIQLRYGRWDSRWFSPTGDIKIVLYCIVLVKPEITRISKEEAANVRLPPLRTSMFSLWPGKRFGAGIRRLTIRTTLQSASYVVQIDMDNPPNPCTNCRNIRRYCSLDGPDEFGLDLLRLTLLLATS